MCIAEKGRLLPQLKSQARFLNFFAADAPRRAPATEASGLITLRCRYVSVVARTAAPRAAQERRTNHGNEGSNPLEQGREVSAPRSKELTPFFTLHCEVNRLFDDAFRGFDLSPFGSDRFSAGGWDGPASR
jgi:hypothetical protein